MPALAMAQEPTLTDSTEAAVATRPDTVRRMGAIERIKTGIKRRINDKLNEPYDTTRDSRY